ncbi:transglutaminase-like domain-containing protein [Inquilinus sp. CAU 1745]|uniref:transglutaminase-like domain-containing protein n=1 Tax=Inquilinus sp. CAU 1745 TaxID=3140369 RepID=UPI00325BE956
MTPSDDILDFYARQSAMTDPGRHGERFRDLPGDPAGTMQAVQGLMIYERVAQEYYGVRLTDQRREESHIRGVAEMLDVLLALDDRLLSEARPPERRLAGICRNFATLMVSMLRAKGVPARLRGGFGTYFNPGWFEDHWVCEYWDAGAGCWRLADPQFDAVWMERFGIDHDVLDVPRDRFIAAPDAWRMCRAGEADPDRFGIAFNGLRGLWFVAGDLLRDLAALNGREMLPWDVWGDLPMPDWRPDDAELAFLDRLAGLTATPDRHFHEWRTLYLEDDRLPVPAKVFNALRQREEAVAA